MYRLFIFPLVYEQRGRHFIGRGQKKAHVLHFIWKMLNAFPSILRAISRVTSASLTFGPKNTRHFLFFWTWPISENMNIQVHMFVIGLFCVCFLEIHSATSNGGTANGKP